MRLINIIIVASFLAAVPTASALENADSLATAASELPPTVNAEAADTATFTPMPLPTSFFLTAVFNNYRLFDPVDSAALFFPEKPRLPKSAQWLEKTARQEEFLSRIKQNYLISHARDVKYVASLMKRPPKKFSGKADPSDRKVSVAVDKVDLSQLNAETEATIRRRNWLREFNGALQFSQAYISPNWYQGGNNNLNAIINIFYNVCLNQNFHPDLLFDTTVKYDLAINNAPTDSIHDINISEDLFQFNTKFGVKAFKKRWFYTITADFKTPLLKNFKPNQHDVTAALFSPGELNVGVGMTYKHLNTKKTFNVNASIAPFSYNLKVCRSHDINPADFGIEAPHRAANKFGSSGELKLKWSMAKNVIYSSRLFLFTNYKYVQGDWENTLEFSINRYLSTRLFAHLRYDTSVPPLEGSKWKRWQFKEILSFGLSYKFSTKPKK